MSSSIDPLDDLHFNLFTIMIQFKIAKFQINRMNNFVSFQIEIESNIVCATF
ncbi:hypothetical protein GLOIN_2v1704838 [Rhizophagus irregularis DAOM 181602=DAOM 197198]|uniref:Uncharacterized protein n=1 Tax=Rhizophagus irregularis (strain DAOM 181602 / DAOM 197198 / MUCL 43194) TaxID=747089 RepID=A0A2P4P7H8_RHIID|nr:hypothetical protein GLOIN_2v1704838 [Rhizophagus irregularis DAOM 181602=DAOM 197198]POG61307.1 hypothetical protein GLOIN_2v1704838 [Rhizophagus irregularis DAOM 181602=DAOM 197198]|eukprot:XP_025168173.1 hypothetical protein GLOIN_2v1704838 [Rhizophagus irregularis DAOM 181602=DAOM 197198]